MAIIPLITLIINVIKVIYEIISFIESNHQVTAEAQDHINALKQKIDHANEIAIQLRETVVEAP